MRSQYSHKEQMVLPNQSKYLSMTPLKLLAFFEGLLLMGMFGGQNEMAVEAIRASKAL